MSGGIIDDPVGGNEDTTVEDSILDDVEEQTGESFDAAEESGDETPDEEDEPAARKPREDHTRERGERREVQSRIPTQRRVDYDYDRQGNVINPKDGSVIYPMGT